MGRNVHPRWMLLAAALGATLGVVAAETPPATSEPDRILQLIENGAYDDAEVAARELLDNVETTTGPDSLETAEALDLVVESARKNGRFMDEELIDLSARALSIKESALGPDHPAVADSLFIQGKLLDLSGNRPRAKEVFARSLRIREIEFGYADAETAEVLDWVGQYAWIVDRDWERAKELLDRSLEIKTDAFGDEDPRVAATLSRLAGGIYMRGGHSSALELYERALEIRLATLGKEHPATGMNYHLLANVIDRLGDFEEARRNFQRAQAIWAATLRPGHPYHAYSLHALANSVAHADGDYAAARGMLERALEIEESALGPEGRVKSLLSLASVVYQSGDYREARRLFEESLELRRNVFGPDSHEAALGMNNLGLCLKGIGDYESARPFLERAAEIWNETFGVESFWGVAGLNNRADLHLAMGDARGAESLFQQAVAVGEEVFGPHHFHVASIVHGQARAHDAAYGDLATSLRLHERALAIREVALGPDHPETAQSLEWVADVLYRSGDFDGARVLLRRALDIRERTLGHHHPDTGRCLFELARIGRTPQEAEHSVEAALESETISRGHLRLTIQGFSEREALRYASVRTAGLDVALSVIAGRTGSEVVDQVWDSVVRSRTLVLDEMAARHFIGTEREKEAAALLAEARQRLANLVVRGQGEIAQDRYKLVLNRARREKESAERALAEASGRFRGEMARHRIGLKEVVASMPPDAALIAYVKYGDLAHLSDPENSPIAGEARAPSPPSSPVSAYMALVLSGLEGSPAAVPIGPTRHVDALIADWKKEASAEPRPLREAADQSEKAFRAAGEALRRAIWDPVVAHLGSAERVFVVPDGAIHLVNLATLPREDGRFLVESGPAIHYVSAERDLVPIDPVTSSTGLLAMGGADFDVEPGSPPVEEGERLVASLSGGSSRHVYRGPTPGCVDFRSLRFESLSATSREVEEVAALWTSDEGSTSDPPEKASLLLGVRAHERVFKTEAPGSRVVHVATHGFFLDGSCDSGLAEARTETADIFNDFPPLSAIGENPLLLSGLALAGANNRAEAAEDQEDGILTAEEIATLDLSSVDWAVLSGCDTGTGRIVSGEGVLGLRRAFEIAGAGTLIMSLWSVEDQSAREWMRELYQGRLADRLSTVDAVQQASRRILERRRKAGRSTHPFYWGAFVAAGDWR